MLSRVLILIFFSVTVYAQNYEGAVVSGNGGAGRAAVDAPESLYMNPATVVHLKNRYLTLGLGQFRQDPNIEGDSFSASISDGTPESSIPASLGYAQNSIDMDGMGKVLHKVFQFSLAGFIAPRLSLGVGLHHKEQTTDVEKYSQNNADIGLLYTPFDNFGVGLVSYDLFAASSKVPESLRNKASQGLGLNYIYKNFIRLRLDFLMSDSDLSSMLGFESYVSEFFVLRAGYRNDAHSELNKTSLGFSFVGPRFAIHYAYLMGTSSQKLTQHAVDFSVPF
jgi:hypothetical protein